MPRIKKPKIDKVLARAVKFTRGSVHIEPEYYYMGSRWTFVQVSIYEAYWVHSTGLIIESSRNFGQ